MNSKLSIITINFNNASGLQKTIQSVLSQTYSDFQYIVIDGGSQDGSQDIISRNRHKFSYWISEPDLGIYNAMNKGIRAARSEYLLFLNSGDYLASASVIQEMILQLADYDLVAGNIAHVKNGKTVIIYNLDSTAISFLNVFNIGIHHQSTFIKSELMEKLGSYNESTKISGDWQFFMKALFQEGASYKYVDKTISIYNYDGVSSAVHNRAVIKAEKEQLLRDLISSRNFKVDLVELFAIHHDLERYSRLSAIGKLKDLLKRTIKSISKHLNWS